MPTPLSIRIAIWIWLLAALGAGQSGLLARVPVAALPILSLALAAGVLAAYFKAGTFRAWMDSIGLRSLLCLHATRFTGFYPILMEHRGELPYAFAVPSGWAECLVAFLALAVAFVPMSDPARRHAIAIWNTMGMVGLASVALATIRFGLQSPAQLSPLTAMPLCLLSSFLLPLAAAIHVCVYVRLNREKAAATS